MPDKRCLLIASILGLATLLLGWMTYLPKLVPPCTGQTQMKLKINHQWASQNNLGKLAKRQIGKTTKLIVYWIYV